ncbi:hypothetical protein KP509_04G010400 [Ceratopteris richardii]|uniref:Probable magnesium transporter n=1 Tax=Ceratopteris richardii TaxID=49495 RepID=A0A8T2UQ57_CERRI|nr:hypothetical protein KP509_04G010400 [Ceratopteris richardii]
MKEWIRGAAINMIGSIGINFGTNLLKLAHNQKERLTLSEAAAGDKHASHKPIIYFQSWWIGMVVFIFGNILNFLSFGYAAQSLLAALGSIQFISNVGFAYFVLNEKVTSRNLVATLFIVTGNVFLVAFGNHQSKVYTQEELITNYGNHVYLIYCMCLIILVTVNHMTYKKGRALMTNCTDESVSRYWHTLLPFSYAMVSGIIGSHSVLFAKSLSVLLRQTLNGENELDGWFTYAILLLFILTASFWMTRLNDGLSLFDAIIIVPMFQIVWTFFSIFTGFVYFSEYQVFDSFRTSVFALGILTLFLGILMLSPDISEGTKDSLWADPEEASALIERAQIQNQAQSILIKGSTVHEMIFSIFSRIKSFCQGFLENRANVSSVFAMPMLASSRMTWRSSVLKTYSQSSGIPLGFEHLHSSIDADN